jgi:16S rRNA (cytosine1402-N4)-methyltransferase
MHLPVLATEAIEAMAIRPDGIYVDGTFGRGGHSRLILERLGPQGRLIALDRDPQAAWAAREINDPRFSFIRSAFSDLSALPAQVHGMLFDLGVSSPQLDDPARGFSFRHDGPLDMRMDPETGMSAAEFIAGAKEQELGGVIRDYGEERFAKQIAAAIVAARGREPITRTRQLAELVAQAVRTREPGQDPATRTFQALRIHVNRELEEVSVMLPQAVARLAPQGRLAVISFHSLEDRIVKRFMHAARKSDRASLALFRRSPADTPALASTQRTRANRHRGQRPCPLS